MVLVYIELIMQLTSIGLMIAAAGVWAGTGVELRPAYRDEQTLVGGTIWSQLIIPIGLMISKIVGEVIDRFVQGYFLVTGIILLWATGIVLIVHEIKTSKRLNARTNSVRSNTSGRSRHDMYDKAYFAIGIICILAGVIKLVELIFIFIS